MDKNPQAQQMADESMVRGLAAQAEAIWPQERDFLVAYDVPAEARILDLACGTGEITARVAGLFPQASLIGVDIHAPHLELARNRTRASDERVQFQVGSAYELDFEADRFDLSLCRHLLQAVPEPERILTEMKRVTRPGGWLHLIAEDYAMMHFHPTTLDTDLFWHRGPIAFAERTGTDLRSGRKIFSLLRGLGLEEISVDYIVIDTQRVPREVFAAIWVAWRDGYAEAIAEETELELPEVQASFEQMLAAIRDPNGYGVWQLPLIRARVN